MPFERQPSDGEEPFGTMQLRFEDGLVRLDAAAARLLNAPESIPVADFASTGADIDVPRKGQGLGAWLLAERQRGVQTAHWVLPQRDAAILRVRLDDAAVELVRETLARDADPHGELRHDLRNQLNNIRMNAAVIEHHGERLDSKEVGEAVARIIRACDQLASLLDEDRDRDRHAFRSVGVAEMAEALGRTGLARPEVIGDSSWELTADLAAAACELTAQCFAGLDRADIDEFRIGAAPFDDFVSVAATLGKRCESAERFVSPVCFLPDSGVIAAPAVTLRAGRIAFGAWTDGRSVAVTCGSTAAPGSEPPPRSN